MIDTPRESLLTLAQAASELPRRRRGRKTNVATLYRWTTVGCRGVRLEFTQIGGTRCTSHEALGRFFDALTRRSQGTSGLTVEPSVTERRRTERAAREAVTALS